MTETPAQKFPLGHFLGISAHFFTLSGSLRKGCQKRAGGLSLEPVKTRPVRCHEDRAYAGRCPGSKTRGPGRFLYVQLGWENRQKQAEVSGFLELKYLGFQSLKVKEKPGKKNKLIKVTPNFEMENSESIFPNCFRAVQGPDVALIEHQTSIFQNFDRPSSVKSSLWFKIELRVTSTL